jgi:hypothetical protein
MRAVRLLGAAAVGGLAYRLVVQGQLTVDVGIGRQLRRLEPISTVIQAPAETVFDVIAEPYLSRTPRALSGELEVLERGSDMVLAAHHTPVGWGLVATTVETVRFCRPDSVEFRLVRGPVPHVVERFALHGYGGNTTFVYSGELGTDLWAAGRWWANRVARHWERTVAASVERIRDEAERRAKAR